jgi:putative ABC transport system substrate-binding protein
MRGTKAGDIPMEQPTTYELAVNARTAKSLGIRIPESIRIRVDRIIDH